MFPNEVAVRIHNAIERITKSFKVIETDHSYIHEGYLFTTPFFVSLAAGAVNKITILTPTVASGKFLHYRPNSIITSADKVTIDFYEGSSGNSGGSDLTPICRNRVNIKTTNAQAIKSGVTVTTNGTLIDKAYVGGGTGVGSSRSGDETGQANELVLKTNTLYTLVITNGSSAANEILVNLKWYEEDSGG